MYEPKYKLNKKDRARFRKLAMKEALNKATLEERVELERLAEKDRKKRWSHPRMKGVKRRARYLDDKLKKICMKLDSLIDTDPNFRRAMGKTRFMDAFTKK